MQPLPFAPRISRADIFHYLIKCSLRLYVGFYAQSGSAAPCPDPFVGLS